MWIALSPLIVLLVSLFLLRWPLFFSSIFAALYTVFLLAFFWDVSSSIILAAFGKGVLIGLDLGLIVFGAVFFLLILKETGHLAALELNLLKLTPTRHLQVLVIAWLFGSFLEGVAGFGTPAAVVAPLLVALGFAPVKAVAIALIANSTAVSFGAVGTPIRVGFAGLDIAGVATSTAMIHLICAPLVPLILTWMVSDTRRDFIRKIPVSLGVAYVFLIPYYAFSYFGLEFPSIGGALVALTVVLSVIYYHQRNELRAKSTLNWRAFSPYLLFVTLLAFTKFFLGDFRLEFAIFGPVAHSFSLFHPGLVFIMTSLMISFFASKRLNIFEFQRSTRSAGKSAAKAIAAIAALSALVQLLIFSKTNPTGSPGAMEILVRSFETEYLQTWATLVGAVGSFLTGSATVSNLLFAPLEARIAENMGLSLSKILAFQLVGGAVGNMISLTNILAVKATVQTDASEPSIFFKTLPACLAYVIAATLVAVAW